MLKLFLVICLVATLCQSEFEICIPGKNNSIYRFSKEKCPSGVLFDVPVQVGCLEATENADYFFKDLCAQEYLEDIQNSGSKKINFVFELDADQLDEQTSCFGNATDRCWIDPESPDSVVDGDLTTMTPPEWFGCDDEDDILMDEPGAAEEVAKHADARVFNQTERLFHFMVGARKDHRERPNNLRLVQILESCFDILRKYCDTNFVPADFGRDILKAFLFLLRDSDMRSFIDVTNENFEIMKKSLDECIKLKSPRFTLTGRTCKTCSVVHNIEKNGHSMRYTTDEFTFEKGKYDIAVDATWGVLTFVHGLCFGNYRPQQNYHHYFQREMERLFTEEIMYRWSRPPKLYFEDLWDHIFSAKVKSIMRNLDSCIQAAYLKTPFLHRLERPLPRSEGFSNASSSNSSTNTTRTPSKRMKILEGSNGLQGAGWCFQTDDDRMRTTEAYVNFYCPNRRSGLEEVQRLANETTTAGEVTTSSPDTTSDENEPEELDANESSESERFTR